MRDEYFGNLLKSALSSIAHNENKKAPLVEDDLGSQIGVTAASIQRYKAGYLPPERRTIEILAEAGVQRGFLGRAWLQRFLQAARYAGAEPLLDRLCPAPVVRSRPPRVYQNLPAPTYSQFVMRAQAFAEVCEGLAARSAAVLVVGLGGQGKTSLAREVADACLNGAQGAPQFDAAVWVSDKDRPGTTNLSIVLDEIARTLDYPGFTQFSHDEKRHEVEQLLRKQKVLLVVDNFETVTDGALLSWLLRLPEPSKALITSREKQRGLWSSWLAELRGMTEAEAQRLIAQRLRMLQLDKQAAAPAEFEPLVAVTGGNPKAIEIALGLVKHERRPLQQVVDELHAARGDLFDDLFARAWSLLDEAARQVLMAMTFFPDSAGGEAVAASADVHGYAFDRAVERLADLALLDVQQADLSSVPRYTLHPLVRVFANARLVEQPSFEQSARERWAEYFHAFTLRCHSEGWDLPLHFSRAEPEITNIQMVIHQYHSLRQWQLVIEMVIAIRMFWNTRGYYRERNNFVNMALEAADALNDIQAQIKLLSIQTRTLCYLDEIPLAIRNCNRARALLQCLKNPEPSLVESVNEAEIRICFRKGDTEKQRELAEENVRSAQQRQSYRVVLHRYFVADYLYLVKRYDEAETMFLQLIEESKAYGYQRAIITGWLALARIALYNHQLDLGEQRLKHARELALGIQHRRYMAESNVVAAQLRILQGDIQAARTEIAEAIDLFERLGMRSELAEARAELARLEGISAPNHA